MRPRWMKSPRCIGAKRPHQNNFMGISSKDVRQIAHLARIALTQAEEERFETELSSILGFIEKLNAADTAGVEPETGGTSLENVMREDGDAHSALEGKAGELLAAALERKEGWIKVRAVFT